ncbi:rCG23105 [Rattus norvegicus]|uniref:RCG23105 n=1 Tax=Rattus norvegicus TaxID=10116 RepID=A6KN55_RAT|nr:rCG23105 [Rattus norvegicus]
MQSPWLGGWHSAADINTRQNSDAFPDTAVALAVAPTQGVKRPSVINAFILTCSNMMGP